MGSCATARVASRSGNGNATGRAGSQRERAAVNALPPTGRRCSRGGRYRTISDRFQQADRRRRGGVCDGRARVAFVHIRVVFTRPEMHVLDVELWRCDRRAAATAATGRSSDRVPLKAAGVGRGADGVQGAATGGRGGVEARERAAGVGRHIEVKRRDGSVGCPDSIAGTEAKEMGGRRNLGPNEPAGRRLCRSVIGDGGRRPVAGPKNGHGSGKIRSRARFHSGGRIRTSDLRVMSPTSYQAALPRDQ